MPSTERLTVSLPRDVAERLDRVVRETREPRSALALQALIGWLDEEEANRAAVLRGLEEAKAGRSVPHKKVLAWLESWGKEDEQAPPTCD